MMLAYKKLSDKGLRNFSTQKSSKAQESQRQNQLFNTRYLCAQLPHRIRLQNNF